MKKASLLVVFLLVVVVGIVLFIKVQKSNSSLTTKNFQNTSKQININEVAKHTTSTDCWMVIDGNVYDVTSYVPEHPGGDQITLGCGKDATSIFNSRPNDGTTHSDMAKNLLSQFQIGVLAK